MSYTAKVIAVLGRTLRAGRWKLSDDSLVIAVFGRCVLDLSRAYVDEDDDELSMTIFVLFGSVSIVLPPGCDVEPSGIALLASSEVEIPSDKDEDITAGVLAPLEISWIAMFGRVRINEFVLEPEPDVLPPPAVEVFDGEGTPPAPNHVADAEQQAKEAEQEAQVKREAQVKLDAQVEQDAQRAEADAEVEQAALRDEIAQWRTETGRPEADQQADPALEIETDPPQAVQPEAADAG